jgi:Domain of unknown function (DUF4337)
MASSEAGGHRGHRSRGRRQQQAAQPSGRNHRGHLRGIHGGGQRQGRQHQPGDAEGEGGIGRRLDRVPGLAHQAARGRERARDAAAHGNVRTDRQGAEYDADIKKYQERSKETRTKAERLEADYERFNFRDDQFDLSQAFLSMATALAAIAALVELSWVLYVAWAAGAYGLFMGMAGFLGLPFRSAFLATLLGT